MFLVCRCAFNWCRWWGVCRKVFLHDTFQCYYLRYISLRCPISTARISIRLSSISQIIRQSPISLVVTSYCLTSAMRISKLYDNAQFVNNPCTKSRIILFKFFHEFYRTRSKINLPYHTMFSSLLNSL